MRYGLMGRNPCCSGPTASTAKRIIAAALYGLGRNPCCSGPTASTDRYTRSRTSQIPLVAIPVVVDLLLRQRVDAVSGDRCRASQSLL